MDEEEIIMSYTEEVYERVVAQNPNEPEFHQAVKEVLDSLKVVIDKNEEKYRKLSILERLVEPERIISFRVPWVDDKGVVQVDVYKRQLSELPPILSRLTGNHQERPLYSPRFPSLPPFPGSQ